MKEEVQGLIRVKNALHPNDPGHTNYWNEILGILTWDKDQTTQFLKQVDRENIVYSLSNFFGAMSGHFQRNDTWWTVEGTGKDAVYHRFFNTEKNVYHWSGSSNGTNKSGRPVIIPQDQIPQGIKSIVTRQ
jgi:hypothetical protein